MNRERYVDSEWFAQLKIKYKLSSDDMDEFIRSFDIINDGSVVTPKRLSEFIAKEINKYYSMVYCQKIIQEINKRINNHRKSILDLETYLKYIIPISVRKLKREQSIKEFFNTLDSDHNKKITCEDLISVLYRVKRNYSSSELKHYKKEIKKICKKADLNNDGVITYDEFRSFMDNIDQK